MKTVILDILLPERCVLCGQWIQIEDRVGDYPLCKKCKALFRFPEGRRCKICSMELTSEQGICMECREVNFLFERNISLFSYRAHVKELILAYKSRGYERLSLFFAELLLPVWKAEFSSIPLVPVPPRPERMKERGFDPIGLISAHIARLGSVPVMPLLTRAKGTKEQKLLSKEQREENLKKAFLLKKETVKSAYKGERLPLSVVLLDDVFTTGATLHRCAEVFKGVGVREVYGLTLARD